MFTSDDDKQLIARLNNGIDLCLTRQKPYFMPFMSERKQALLASKLKKAYFDNYLFFGGYDDSERKMLGLFFDEPSTSMFPICGIEFSFRKCDRLTHRDFLGSLMSLGIERETVGDILVEDGRAVVFVKRNCPIMSSRRFQKSAESALRLMMLICQSFRREEEWKKKHL